MYLQLCTSRKGKEISPYLPKADKIQTVTRLMPQYEERIGHRRTTITDLPGPILDHIVSFLPMRDLAHMRASFKPWRNLWYTTPFVRLDITQPLDTLFGFSYLGMEDKVPSLHCVLRLSDKPHEDMLTMSHCHVDFLKLYINFSDFEMQFIASFLGRFPNLKFLSIHQSSWNDCIHLPQSNVSDLYWASQNLPFIEHLKILEISLCPGDNALALMKYLTKNGKNLEYLVIRYSSRFWEMSELDRVIDDIEKEKASFELRFCSQAEPNPPKFEEVNEHHRKYALLLTEKEKREIYEQKILRRYPEFQEFGLPIWYTAEFMDESLNCWMPPAFRDGPGLDESMDFCSDF